MCLNTRPRKSPRLCEAPHPQCSAWWGALCLRPHHLLLRGLEASAQGRPRPRHRPRQVDGEDQGRGSASSQTLKSEPPSSSVLPLETGAGRVPRQVPTPVLRTMTWPLLLSAQQEQPPERTRQLCQVALGRMCGSVGGEGSCSSSHTDRGQVVTISDPSPTAGPTLAPLKAPDGRGQFLGPREQLSSTLHVAARVPARRLAWPLPAVRLPEGRGGGGGWVKWEPRVLGKPLSGHSALGCPPRSLPTLVVF